jgi:hypothetical protein
MDLEDASEGHDKGKGKALAPEPTSSSKQQNLAGIKQPIRIVVKPNGSAVIESVPTAETSTEKQDDQIVAGPKRPIRIVVKPKQVNATTEDSPSAEAAATEQDHETTRKIPKKPTTKRKKKPMLEQHAATPGPSRPREIRPRAVPEAIPEPVHEPVSEPVFEPASEMSPFGMPAFERPNLQRPEIPIQDIGGYSFLPLTFDEGANFGRVWCPLNLRGEPEAHWKVFPPNKNYPVNDIFLSPSSFRSKTFRAADFAIIRLLDEMLNNPNWMARHHPSEFISPIITFLTTHLPSCHLALTTPQSTLANPLTPHFPDLPWTRHLHDPGRNPPPRHGPTCAHPRRHRTAIQRRHPLCQHSQPPRRNNLGPQQQ